ncbi:MAG: M23 family metallopeptidase [Candidatus Doudnabacteria bacterium]|nr:M23 family metallopeptidase [Candidatus Doudnabacteria bacterium]
MTKKHSYTIFTAILALSLLFPASTPVRAQLSTIRTIVFPVIGAATYSDDFGDGRSGGRTHEGNDIFGKKMWPLVAAVDGTISTVVYPQATWGYSVTIRDADGYRYNYLHINNDNPGTDDGQGGGFFAYAPDVMRGNKVVKGQLIGWMGDSGNAETTTAHLHFEIRTPDGQPFSPYQSLRNATKIAVPINHPALPHEILPFESFSGGASIALGNLDDDSSVEVVAGARVGGGPLVRTYETTNKVIDSWYAYDPNFFGGVDVATGDVDDDGVDDVIVAPGPGGGPHIKVYEADGKKIITEFMAYDPLFRGGVNVTSADVLGDDDAEIITSPASKGGPHVKVFDSKGKLLKEFMAYDGNFTAGIDIAAAKGRTKNVIATAPNAGGGPHVKLFDEDGKMTEELMAYDGNFHGGVRIAASASSARTEPTIHVMPASKGGPHHRTISMSGTLSDGSLVAFEPWWNGGYDIAVRGTTVFVSSVGGRRTTIRNINFNSSFSDEEPRRRRSY